MANLLPFDGKLLGETEEGWERQLLAHDINPARCRGAIARAKEILGGKHNQQYAYAYIGITGNVDGIALLSHARPESSSPWLKVLELTLAPAFVDDDNPTPLDDLVSIASTVVTEVFRLSSDKHKSESIKIYGDSVMDVRMWKSVARHLQGQGQEQVQMPFDASSHGRWLVLARNGG